MKTFCNIRRIVEALRAGALIYGVSLNRCFINEGIMRQRTIVDITFSREFLKYELEMRSNGLRKISCRMLHLGYD